MRAEWRVRVRPRPRGHPGLFPARMEVGLKLRVGNPREREGVGVRVRQGWGRGILFTNTHSPNSESQLGSRLVCLNRNVRDKENPTRDSHSKVRGRGSMSGSPSGWKGLVLPRLEDRPSGLD